MLDSIIFHNFKTFSDQSIPLRSLTLLTGVNGTGKSSVLQALAMLRQSFDAGFLIGGAWLLNGELIELGTGRDVAFEDSADDLISITVGGFDRSNAANKIIEISVVDRKSNDDVLWETTPGRREPGRWSQLAAFDVGFQYLRADRITPAVTFPKSQHAIQTRRFLGSRGEFSPHYLLEYGEDDIPCRTLIRNEEEFSGRLLSQVNAWLQELSPGVRVDVENVPMTDLVRLEFAFRTRGPAYGGPFRPTNVGFGLTHALPVLVGCLGARPGNLLLIENPEAQLHPQGQIAIGGLLAKLSAAGVQVIVETHSDHILNGIRLAVRNGDLSADQAAFHFFSRNDSAKVTLQSPKIDENGLLSEWPSGFFTQWDDALVELLR
jgi:predicted ATPase